MLMIGCLRCSAAPTGGLKLVDLRLPKMTPDGQTNNPKACFIKIGSQAPAEAQQNS